MALTLQTFLEQRLTFNAQDILFLLRKVRSGDVRTSSGVDNGFTVPDSSPFPGVENGSAGQPFVRISGIAAFDDGISSPNVIGSNGVALPNERLVSNTVSDTGRLAELRFDPNAHMLQSGGWNNLLMSVSQYIYHGLDFINKGGAGTYTIPDLPGAYDGAVGALNSTRATPAAGTGGSAGNPRNYANTVSPWIDQNQTYGSHELVTFLLRETLRDGDGNVVRDSNGNLLKTALLLEGHPGPDGILSNPTYYDILLNNGVDKSALDAILASVATAHAHYNAAWDAYRASTPDQQVDRVYLARLFNTYITPADSAAMAAAKAALAALPGYVSEGLLPGTTDQTGLGQTLIGDLAAQSQALPIGPGQFLAGDVANLLKHFVAGDLRVNENTGLSAFHQMFAQNHNNHVEDITAAIAALNSDADPTNDIGPVTSNEIFDIARIVQNGQYQRMVFDQYVLALAGGIPQGFPLNAAPVPADVLLGGPLVLGEHGFLGWTPEVNGNISLEFAFAAFRVGHSQIYRDLGIIDAFRTNGDRFDGSSQQVVVAANDASANIAQAADTVAESLVNLFLNPEAFDSRGGGAAFLAGNAREPAQQVDTYLTNAVRNLLVGSPQDLGAFNLARARESGVPSLNEFRKAISTMLATTGIGNSLGVQSSDLSVGLFDPLAIVVELDANGNPVLDVNGDPIPVLDVNGQTIPLVQNLLADIMRPYVNWADFGHNLRDWQPSLDANGVALVFDANNAATYGTSFLRDAFMTLYGAPSGSSPVINIDGTVTVSSNPYPGGFATMTRRGRPGRPVTNPGAALNNDWGLDNVDLWIGGLAEAAVLVPTGDGLLQSLAGSTFTFIIQEQFDRLQDGDRFYYKLDLAGTDLLNTQIVNSTFSALVQSSSGAAAQYIHQDTFRNFELHDLAPGVVSFNSPFRALLANGLVDPNLPNDLIIANSQNNILTGNNARDDIRGGAGSDTITGGDETDYLWGQGGGDLLLTGRDIFNPLTGLWESDLFIDFLYGGDGNDTLDASGNTLGDILLGENGNDTLIGSNEAFIVELGLLVPVGDNLNGGLGADTIYGNAGNDLITGDSGAPDIGLSAVNVYGVDYLFGGIGSDIITGGGEGDIIIGGLDADTIHGDWVPTSNAELLARAIRTNGVITGTLEPLNFEIGTVVVIDEINPITGLRFTAAQLQEFQDYLTSLRVNPNGAPGGDINPRGPVPLLKIQPYVGPEGGDLIEGDDRFFDPTNPPVILVPDPLDPLAPPVPVIVLPDADKIFADGGNDTIRPGAGSDVIFAGRGFDLLDYSLQPETFNPLADGTPGVPIPNSFRITLDQVLAPAAGDTANQADGSVLNLLANDAGIADNDIFYSVEHIKVAGASTNDEFVSNTVGGDTYVVDATGAVFVNGIRIEGVETFFAVDGGDTLQLAAGTGFTRGTSGAFRRNIQVGGANGPRFLGIETLQVGGVNQGINTNRTNSLLNVSATPDPVVVVVPPVVAELAAPEPAAIALLATPLVPPTPPAPPANLQDTIVTPAPTPPASPAKLGVIDTLSGVSGSQDAFFLGTAGLPFYNSMGDGTKDYALINNFENGSDVIVLAGQRTQYKLVANFEIDGSAGTGIFHRNNLANPGDDDLIGVVADTSGLSLFSSSQFLMLG
ncbi:peroxidase family protein [Synechococcus sp. EJ6-Ellesmere]|uniref:peroxidase family protein n=1 Tax=Synechococcus sp. EJ6-Ellesmere TaxID=2823734 RepID=UPI0020CF2CC9|nr:peroxidase family protein [Synechococcus sp. EJ6-Ellesmere]MCP9824139.1 hypothetical protein [Synechococcus sp. EJ6-Ellesmere]